MLFDDIFETMYQDMVEMVVENKVNVEQI